jgi:hypothetical protein
MYPRVQHTLLSSVVALLTVAAPVRAQRADALPVGVRVRVHRLNPPPVAIGILLRSDSAGLTLAKRNGEQQMLSWSEVTRVDRHVGQRSAGEGFKRGAQRGALVGAVVGGAATYAALLSEQRNPCDGCMISGSMVVGALSVVFLGVSTLVGGAIGSTQRDRWKAVPLH